MADLPPPPSYESVVNIAVDDQKVSKSVDPNIVVAVPQYVEQQAIVQPVQLNQVANNQPNQQINNNQADEHKCTNCYVGLKNSIRLRIPDCLNCIALLLQDLVRCLLKPLKWLSSALWFICEPIGHAIVACGRFVASCNVCFTVGTFLLIVFALCIIGLLIFPMIIGAIYLNDSCSKPLASWLITWSVTVIAMILCMTCLIRAFMYRAGDSPCLIIPMCCSALLPLFLIVWLIVGSVWTFGLDDISSQCTSWIYITSKGTVLGSWCAIGLGIILLCCLLNKF